MPESNLKRVPEAALQELKELLVGIERESHRALAPIERILYSAIWMHGWRTRDEQEQECPTPQSDQSSPTA